MKTLLTIPLTPLDPQMFVVGKVTLVAPICKAAFQTRNCLVINPRTRTLDHQT